MGRDNFISMRQVNFVLWIAALVTTWHDPTNFPVGHQWIPIAGMVVSLFWPGKAKAKEVEGSVKSVGG